MKRPSFDDVKAAAARMADVEREAIRDERPSDVHPLSPGGLADELDAVRAAAGPENDAAPAVPLAPLPVLADLALQLGALGPRLAFGVRPLDEAWRGGAPTGTFVVVQAAPGTGKTTWALERGHRWAEKSVPVVFVAADEGRDGLLVRLGQQHGIDRKMLEDGGENAKATLAEHLRPLPLYVVDVDTDEGADLVTAARRLRAAHPEGHAVLIVDSIQAYAQSYAAAAGPVTSIRERIDAVVRTLKMIAKTQKMIVIALSEVGRGSYGRKNPEEQTADLAASKESSGIEYGAGAVMMMRNRRGENGVVDVSFPKARLGRIEPFVLRQNFEYATFSLDTTSRPPAEDDDPSEVFDALRAAVLAVVQSKPGMSAPAIIEQLPRGVPRRRAAILAALAELARTGRVENRGARNAPSWHPVGQA